MVNHNTAFAFCIFVYLINWHLSAFGIIGVSITVDYVYMFVIRNWFKLEEQYLCHDLYLFPGELGIF